MLLILYLGRLVLLIVKDPQIPSKVMRASYTMTQVPMCGAPPVGTCASARLLPASSIRFLPPAILVLTSLGLAMSKFRYETKYHMPAAVVVHSAVRESVRDHRSITVRNNNDIHERSEEHHTRCGVAKTDTTQHKTLFSLKEDCPGPLHHNNTFSHIIK